MDVEVLEVLSMLREELMDELEAINQYEDHLQVYPEEIVPVIKQIINDEKRHVKMLLELIEKWEAKVEG